MKMTSGVFLTSALVLCTAQIALAEGSGTIITDARMRSAPSTVNTPTVTVLKRGTTVSIIEEKGGWYHITANNLEGWTAAWLINQTVAPTPVTTSQSATYTTAARVRTGPGTGYAIVHTFLQGTTVSVYQNKNGWYEIGLGAVRGWTAGYLLKIDTAAAAPVVETPAPLPYTSPVVVPGISSGVTRSSYQGGVVPDGIDLTALNNYWLEKLNTLRVEKNLRLLVLDQRWVDTASEYAVYMGENDVPFHARADGKTMHQWIDTKGLTFTKRYSPGGWSGNYFTENLSRGVTSGTTESVEKNVLDRAMEYFLNEGPTGAHYRTVYHADWNSVGLGFYFQPRGDGRYDVSAVFHYGSLQL